MHFFARHRENIRQSSMSSQLLWPCLLLAALLLKDMVPARMSVLTR